MQGADLVARGAGGWEDPVRQVDEGEVTGGCDDRPEAARMATGSLGSLNSQAPRVPPRRPESPWWRSLWSLPCHPGSRLSEPRRPAPPHASRMVFSPLTTEPQKRWELILSHHAPNGREVSRQFMGDKKRSRGHTFFRLSEWPTTLSFLSKKQQRKVKGQLPDSGAQLFGPTSQTC